MCLCLCISHEMCKGIIEYSKQIYHTFIRCCCCYTPSYLRVDFVWRFFFMFVCWSPVWHLFIVMHKFPIKSCLVHAHEKKTHFHVRRPNWNILMLYMVNLCKEFYRHTSTETIPLFYHTEIVLINGIEIKQFIFA